MKKTTAYYWFMALLIAQANVFAASVNNKIIYRLERTEYSGFTLPEYAKSSQCIIYNNGNIVIKNSASILTTTSRDKVQIEGDLQDLIVKAAEGKFTTNPYPVDASTITYIAYPDKFPPTVKLAPIALFEQNGGTGQEIINENAAATVLRNFIDLHCSN
ncbi:MAG: hypothetical protein ABL919_00665 [Methylococcales bacterium]|nr:hypothetical protein [Methylococcaceae bacterium]